LLLTKLEHMACVKPLQTAPNHAINMPFHQYIRQHPDILPTNNTNLG